MVTRFSYRAKRAIRLAFAASWMALAAAGSAVAADFDHGLTSYLLGRYNDAFDIWRDLAEAGDKEAQFGFGLLYEQGRGVSRDLPTAAAWYSRAAEQGAMRAQTQIAGMYDRGHGVTGDWRQAIAWWLRAEAQGSMRAKFHLGQAYQYGSGVELDLDKAVQWYDESAALGYRPAALLIVEINRQREAEEAAAAPPAEPGSGGMVDVEAPQADGQAPSVFHESLAALESQGASPLIALGDASAQPLEESHRIYLASYRGIQLAGEGWQGMADANADLLGGLVAAVAQIDLGREKGIVYRLQAGPLAGISNANALCYKLNQRQIPCIVVKP